MKIGILGCGSIGQRHRSNLQALGHSVGWYEPRSGHDANWRDRVINSDAIIVCSPSEDHTKDLMDVIDAGKHVLVEKPFGYDCPPLLDGYLQGARVRWPKMIIATGFNLRFHHCVIEAKKWIPELGRLKAAMFTVRQKSEKPAYLRDGIIRNWLSHELDLARHLLGDIEEIVSCEAPIDEHGNDSTEAHITAKFKNVQNNVHFEADYLSAPEQRYFWVEGEHGAIYVDLVRRNVFMRDKEGKHTQVLAAMDTWDQNYMDEMRAFIASIELGKYQNPLATGEDGVANLYAIMQAREKAGIC